MITSLAGRRLPDRRAVPGLAGQDRRRLSRGECAAQRFRLRVGGGAGRAWAPTENANASPSASARPPIFPCGWIAPSSNLKGSALDDAAVKAAVTEALADIDALADLHASAEYRRRVAVNLATRAVADALAHAQGKKPMRIELNVNGTVQKLEVEPRTTLLDCLRDQLALTGAHAGCEHGVCGACTVLFDGVAVRSCLMFAVAGGGLGHHDHRGRHARPRRAVADPGRVLRNPRHAMRLLHAGHDPGRACAARRQSGADARGHRRGDLRQYLPLHRLCADHRSDRARRRTHAGRRTCRRRSPDDKCWTPIPLRLHRPPRARRPPLRRRQRPLRRRHRRPGNEARGAGDVPPARCADRRDRQTARAGHARRALRAGRRRTRRRRRCR